MQRATKKLQTKKLKVKTSKGTFLLEVGPKGLYAVRFPGQYHLYRKHTPGVCCGARRVCVRVGKQFLKYFKNPERAVRIKVDLTNCTPFQRKVYAALIKIPAGRVITYAELAKKAGYPTAVRAVGSAMRKNRLPVVIPCHRVVPSGGGIGNYSAGVKWKRLLLEHEEHCCARRKGQGSRQKTLWCVVPAIQ